MVTETRIGIGIYRETDTIQEVAYREGKAIKGSVDGFAIEAGARTNIQMHANMDVDTISQVGISGK